MRVSLLAIAIVALTSCATTKIEPEKLTGCDHYSGWCDQIRATAVETFTYAQMAANAYAGEAVYDLGDDYRLVKKTENDSIGFAYAIYEAVADGSLTIAFRGTEGANFKDWWYGNLLGRQNARGAALVDELRATEAADKKINLTGHSLGGGIAIDVSLKRENVDAFVFNTSPRFSRDGYDVENRRVSVVENGEILKALRAPSREATQTYTSIDCSKGGPFRQHPMAKLATCLTQIAATESPEALKSLQRNGIDVAYPK